MTFNSLEIVLFNLPPERFYLQLVSYILHIVLGVISMVISGSSRLKLQM